MNESQNLTKDLFGSKTKAKLSQSNREVTMVIKDHMRYLRKTERQVNEERIQTLRKQANKERQLKRRERCMRKKVEDQMQLKMKSHHKMVRDQLANYVRKM